MIEVAGDHVDDRAGNEERRHLAYAGGVVFVLGLLNQRQAADAGTDGDTNALGVGGAFLVEPGIPDRLNPGGQAKMDEGIHAACILGGDVAGDVEISDFTGKSNREGGCIESGDRANARTAGNNILPALFDAVSNRADEPQTSNYNSTTCQGELRTQMWQGRPWGRPCQDRPKWITSCWRG